MAARSSYGVSDGQNEAGRPVIDVVCVGECMALVAPDPVSPLGEGASLRLGVAGAEFNVAVTLARLGAAVSWWGRIGDDPFGDMIVRRLCTAEVDVSHVVRDATRSTGLYVKDPTRQAVHYYREGSAASAMDEQFLSDLPNGALVHVSGVTPALSPGCADMVMTLLTKPRGGMTSFDVNFRPKLWPVAVAAPQLTAMAQLADLVFVGRDEAETLWGTKTPADIRAHLQDVSMVVVKDAERGATVFTNDTAIFEPSPEVLVKEAVGAGDAFAAGYLYGVIERADTASCLRLGHLLAGQALKTIEDIGQPPTEEAVLQILRSA